MFQQRFDGSVNISTADVSNQRIRLIAAPRRLYAIIHSSTSTDGLKLVEVYPDGSGFRLIGSLFTGSNSTTQYCAGATWDEQNGVIKAIIHRNNRITLYSVSTSTGQASVPQPIAGISNLYALSARGSSLIAVGARSLYSIDSEGALQNIANKSLPFANTDVTGLFNEGGDKFLVTGSTGAVWRYDYAANTSTQIDVPSFSSGRLEGVCKFGGNLYLGNVLATSAAVRFLRANTVTRVGTKLFSAAGNIAAVKKNDAVIWATANAKLYQVNTYGGTVTEIGDLNLPSPYATRPNEQPRILVWDGTRLYGFGASAIYTINTSTGTATLLAQLGVSPNYVFGYAHADAVHNGIYLVQDTGARNLVQLQAGQGAPVGHLHAETMLPGLSQLTGGFGEGDDVYGVRGNGDFLVSTTGSSRLLDINSAATTYQQLFEINGSAYTLERHGASNDVTLVKYDGLFPRFYRRGTPLVELQVDDPAPVTVDTTDLTETLPLAHGGTGPYIYELLYNDDSNLPAGVTFNAVSRNVTFDASAMTAGSYVLEYRVADSEDPRRQVSQSFLVTKTGATPPPVTGNLAWTPPADAAFDSGSSHILTLPAATGGTPPYSYRLRHVVGAQSLDTLPHGFSFNANTRTLEISSSAEDGQYEFDMQVNDRFGVVRDNFAVTIQTPLSLDEIINDVGVFNDQDYQQILPEAQGDGATKTYDLNTLQEGSTTIGTGVNLVTNNIFNTISSGGVGWLRTPQGTTIAGSINRAPAAAVLGLVYESGNAAVYTVTDAGQPDLRGLRIGGSALTEEEAAYTITINGVSSRVTQYTLSVGALTVLPEVQFVLNDGTLSPATVTSPDTLTALPAGFTFNRSTRQFRIAGSGSVPGRRHLRYTATSGDQSATKDFDVVVNTNNLLRLNGGVFSGHTGTENTYVLPAASGGDGTYTYTLRDGGSPIPSGVTFAPATRTVTVGASVPRTRLNLRYSVSDGAGQRVNAIVEIVQLAAVPTLTLPDPVDITFYKDTQNRSASLPAAAGGVTPYTYALVQSDDSALPSGMSFTASTRAFTIETRVAVGTYNLKYTVTDSANPNVSAEQEFVVTVQANTPVPLALSSPGTQTITLSGSDQTITLPAATGGQGTIEYGIDAQNPDALTHIGFETATRVMTVRSTIDPGRYTIEYFARDATDTERRVSFILVVDRPLTLPDLEQLSVRRSTGTVRHVLPVASGGTENFTYSITGNPTGVSFNAAAREISIDTANTAVGRYTVIYTVNDGVTTENKSFYLTVDPIPSPPTPMPPIIVDPKPRPPIEPDPLPTPDENYQSNLNNPCSDGAIPVRESGANVGVNADGSLNLNNAACGLNTAVFRCGEDVDAVPGMPGGEVSNAVITDPSLPACDTPTPIVERAVPAATITGLITAGGYRDDTLYKDGNNYYLVFQGERWTPQFTTDGIHTAHSFSLCITDSSIMRRRITIYRYTPTGSRANNQYSRSSAHIINSVGSGCERRTATYTETITVSGGGTRSVHQTQVTQAGCARETLPFSSCEGISLTGAQVCTPGSAQATKAVVTDRAVANTCTPVLTAVEASALPTTQTFSSFSTGVLYKFGNVFFATLRLPVSPTLGTRYATLQGCLPSDALTAAKTQNLFVYYTVGASISRRAWYPITISRHAGDERSCIQGYIDIHIRREMVNNRLRTTRSYHGGCRQYEGTDNTCSEDSVGTLGSLKTCVAGTAAEATPGTPAILAPRVTRVFNKLCAVAGFFNPDDLNFGAYDNVAISGSIAVARDGEGTISYALISAGGANIRIINGNLVVDAAQNAGIFRIGIRARWTLNGTTADIVRFLNLTVRRRGPAPGAIAITPEPRVPEIFIQGQPGIRPSHDLDIIGRDLVGVLGCGDFVIPLPVAQGGSGNYTYAVYDLPDGVLYDNELHALVGHTEVPFEDEITLRVFDGTGASSDERMTLRLVEAANVDNPLYTIQQYNQVTIKDIVDRRLALTLDISHMRIYKQEVRMDVYFDDARAGRIDIQRQVGIEQGKFSIQKEGGRTYIHIAPEVVRSMYGQLQSQATGCWYIEMRSSLEPLKHRTEFGNTDISETALEEEFKRLDIQDQTKIVELSAVPPEPTEDSVSTAHIKPEAVLTNHLNNGAVQQRALAAGAVTTDKLKDGAVARAKLQEHSVTDTKIEQNKVDTPHLQDGAVKQAKLADPSQMLASPIHITGNIEDAAVTTVKLKDGSVGTRALANGAVVSSKIKSVSPDKVSELTPGNLKDAGFFRTLADREVNTDNIRDGAVGRRQLDYLNLAKYMRNEMAIFDLPVLNPDQIPPGTPCGFHVLPGDTKPTAFRLEGQYEYVPEEVKQDPRDISVYGGFQPGGEVPEEAGKTIRVKKLSFGTTDVTDPTKGVHCLNRLRVGDTFYVAYFVQGAYLHTSNKVYRANLSAVPAAVSGASNDLTNFNRRLNLVIERRTDIEDPESTTHFYMNTVIWNSAVDFDTDTLTQHSTIELDKIEGRENTGGVYAGVHLSVAGTTEQSFAKKLGTAWRVPLSSGTPNNLPPIRTQVYAFSALSTSFSNASTDVTAWKQAILDAPKLSNSDGAYETVASRINLSRSTAANKALNSINGLPGFGISMIAESDADADARRQQSKYSGSPEVPLLHVCIPGQGLEFQVRKDFLGRVFGPNYDAYYYIPVMKYAFGVKDTTINNKWAVSYWSQYTDSDSTADERQRSSGSQLPADLDERAAINGGAYTTVELDEDGAVHRDVALMSNGFLVGVRVRPSTASGIFVSANRGTALYERDIPQTGQMRSTTRGVLPQYSDLTNPEYLFFPTADNLAPRNLNSARLVWFAHVKTTLASITRELYKQSFRGPPQLFTDVYPITAVPGTQIHVQAVFSTSGIYRYAYTSAVGSDEVTITRGLRRYAPNADPEDT